MMPKRSIFFLLLFASVAIYANVLNGNFLLDDGMLIVTNEYIKNIKTIPLLFNTNIFSSSPYSFDVGYNYYRPLQVLSFAIDYSIWRLNPFGYHLTNIIIHSCNALLVFYLIYRLFANRRLALLSSILFCVHPIHTESVSYISGRSELLVSLFTLSTLVFYMKHINSANTLAYIISIVSFVSALLSREAGFLIFVPLFLLFIGTRSNLSKASVWLHFFSFTGIFAIYIALRFTILVPIESSPVSPFPLWLDILNFLNVLIEYIKLLIFPYHLHILRTIGPIQSYQSMYAIGPILFLISLIIISIVSIKQKRYILLSGISWFILTLLYLIRFMYKFSSPEKIITMEEHWVYLASLGFFVILSYLILNIKNYRLAAIISAFIIGACVFLTVINNRHWREELSFYRYNLKFVKPHPSIIPRLNYVTALYKRGLFREALDEVNYILAISPENWRAHIQAGDILRLMKRFSEAKQAYRNALKIDYFCWQANLKLKQLCEETGEPYKEDIDPRLPPDEARIVSLIRLGDFSEAIEILNKRLLESPTPQFYTLAGITLGKMGIYKKAIDAFNAALKINPNYPQALYNLSVIYEKKKIKSESIPDRKKGSSGDKAELDR